MNKILILIAFGLTGCAYSSATKNEESSVCTSHGISKFYRDVGLEVFPVSIEPDQEISFEEFRKTSSETYEVLTCKGSGIPLELSKYINGKITYSYEYVYESNKLVALRFLYLNGEATTYQVMQEI